MNIIVLENEPSSQRGGQELSFFEVCQGLCRKGHTLTFLYTKEGDLLPEYKKISENVIKINRYQIVPKYSPAAWLCFMADILKVPVKKDSVIYSNQYHDTLFGSVLSFMKRAPFVCHLRLMPPDPFCGQWIVGLKNVSRFIAISDKTREEWISTGRVSAEKTERVYNGVNTDRFFASPNVAESKAALGLPRDAWVVSYVGRLDRDKGIETLLEAAAELVKSEPKLKVALAGKQVVHPTENAAQNYQKELEEKIRKSGLSETAVFLGHIAQVEKVYQASDIVVLPTTVAEAFGRTIVEAMACQVPVVAARVGGVPEVMGQEFSRFLFQAGNASELASKLRELSGWRLKQPSLGIECRKRVSEKFPLDKTIDGIEEVLRRTARA